MVGFVGLDRRCEPHSRSLASVGILISRISPEIVSALLHHGGLHIARSEAHARAPSHDVATTPTKSHKRIQELLLVHLGSEAADVDGRFLG